MFEQYGPVAIVTYLAIFALVFAGFAVAISMGVPVDSAGGTAGILGAAYVATKLTQPLRSGASQATAHQQPLRNQGEQTPCPS